MARFRRIPQPPIEPHARGEERRPAWIGVVIAAVAVAMLMLGAWQVHRVVYAGRYANVQHWRLVRDAAHGFVGGPAENEIAITQPADGLAVPVEPPQGQPDCPT